MSTRDREGLEAAKAWAQEHLDNDLIIGFGVGDYILYIYLSSEDPELKKITEIDGVPIKFVEIGQIVAV